MREHALLPRGSARSRNGLPTGVSPAPRHGRLDQGQSSVELALTIPFILMLLMILVQASLFVVDHVMVVHAAREAARTAAVTADMAQIEAAARRGGGLEPSRLRVTQRGRAGAGSSVTVRIDYDSPVRVPGIVIAWHSAHLSAEATMRVEQ